MAGSYAVTFIDHAGQSSTFRVHTPEVDEVNYVEVEGKMVALRATVEVLSLGKVVKDARTWSTIRLAPDPPVSEVAQRETKYLVRYRDAVTHEIFNCEIPVADPEQLPGTNTDVVDLGDGNWPAFVTAFEDVVLSKNGNAVVILQAILVARRMKSGTGRVY